MNVLAFGQEDRLSQAEVNFQTRFIEASKHRILGDYEKAEDLLIKLLDEDKTSATVHYELSLLYKELGQNDQALKAVKKAVEYDDQNEWFLQMLAELAEETLQYDDALRAFETLYHNFPRRHNYLKNIAYIYLLDNKPQKAIQTLDKLEKRTLPSIDIVKQKHMIYERLGNQQKAIQVLDHFLDYDPYNMEALRLIAAFLVKEGKLEDAAIYYNEILELEPENNAANLALVRIRNKLNPGKDPQKSLARMIDDLNISLDDKIKQLIPIVTELNLSGDALLAEQLDHFAEILLNLHGEDPKIFALRGDISSSTNDHKAAIKYYKASIDLFDANYMVWEQLLYSFRALNDNKNLLNYAEEAIDLFPNKASAFILYAQAQNNIGNYNDAHQAIHRARIIAGNNKMLVALSYRTEANIYLKQNKAVEARQSFLKAINNEPSNASIMNEYCTLLLNENALNEAEQLIKEVLDLDPKNLNALINKAYLLQLQGQAETALSAYDKALRHGANKNPFVLTNYANLLLQMGKNEKALEYLQKALDLDRNNLELQSQIKKLKTEIN